MEDELVALPPTPALARGRSAVGVQNNVGLVMEQVGLALQREPSLHKESKPGKLDEDMIDVPPGPLALMKLLSKNGEDEPLPSQMLAMIRSRSMDLANKVEALPNEQKAFELADPHNIPLPPDGEIPVPPVREPFVFRALAPPPAPYAPGFDLPSSSSLSSSSPSSGEKLDLPECPLCGGTEGETVEEEKPPEEPAAVASSSPAVVAGQVFTKPSKDKPAPLATPARLPYKNEVYLLDCSHTICKACFTRQLAIGWTGARASFNYMNCGFCGKLFASQKMTAVAQALTSHFALKKKVEDLAIKKFNEEGVALVKELQEKGKLANSYTQTEKEALAVVTMAIYKCVDCKEVFCGGRVSCAEEMDHDPKNMRCQACVWARLARETDLRCMQHGFKFAIFKCDSCCAVATWDCGWNHFCERCHGQAHNSKDYPCPGPDKCPLGIPHPKNLPANFGQSSDNSFIIPFVIGCMACVGYTQENPGCSRPSPAEMQWEVKKDPEKEAEFQRIKEAQLKQEAEDRKKAEEQRKQREEEMRKRREEEAAKRLEQEKEKQKQQEEEARRRKEEYEQKKGAEMAKMLEQGEKHQAAEAMAAVGKCSEAKCKCVAFVPQKWQVNRCHKCFHWAKCHSV